MASFRHFAWRFFVISSFCVASFRYFVFSRGVFSLFRVALFRYFVFSRGVISLFLYFAWRYFVAKRRKDEMAQISHHSPSHNSALCLWKHLGEYTYETYRICKTIHCCVGSLG